MSQVLTSTNVPSNSVHPQHRNPSASNAAAEIRPNIETLQVQDHDTAHGTASAETGTTGTTQREMKNSRANIVIIQLTATALLASISSGLINICIPRMAIDLKIAPELYFWPLSVYGLTSGSCLLLAGAAADVVGCRPIYLAGCFLAGCFVLGCGLSRTGIELIMFRAMQGIAQALCLPTSVGILTNTVPSGKRRNVAFACLGLGQVLGFSIGLVLGGMFVDTVGWRIGWYSCASLVLVLLLVGIVSIPSDRLRQPPTMKRLMTEIDWIGGLLATACLAMLSYVLIMVSSDASIIKSPSILIILIISLTFIPAFIYWVGRQERHQKPALIPNSLWRKLPFTTICFMIILSFATMQCMELFCSLFWQDVQKLPALQASVRFLPSMILAAILNLSTGIVVHRVPAIYLVLLSTIICAVAPLIMAIIKPDWPYWYAAFPAQLLAPLSPDVIFTVGIILVSEVFPESTQALGGAVFNTVAQFGQSIGLGIVGIISNTVTENSAYSDKSSPEALLVGYHAGFWMCFGWMVLSCFIGVYGLRNIGKVGLKRD